ncbi:hypothetical protein AGLY_013373, partial [Aphis glycines]
YWNRYNTRKEVETFHQLSSTTQQPSLSPPSPPTPSPPSPPSSSPLQTPRSPSPTPLPPSPPSPPSSPSLTPLPPSPPSPTPSPPSPPSSSPSPTPPLLSLPLQQKHQLMEPPVENCVTILTGDTIVIAEKTTRRQVSPKSPLMIFNELIKNTNIQIQEHQWGASNHITSYTAMFEIGGKTYIGNHRSKQQAKQKACEKYLMTLSQDQLIKKKRSSEIEVGENTSNLKTKRSHQKDFLWSQFASFAMHNFINQREFNPSIKMANCIPKESTVIKPQPKTGDTIVIAEKTTRRQVSPKSPLMIFNELIKNTNIQIQEHQWGASNHITSYTAMFEIGGKTYIGNHRSKQQAKQKACEKYLMTIFKDIIKKKGSPEIEVGENTSNLKTKSPHQEDFPGLPFASFAMRNLINQWEVEPVVTGA